MHGRQVAKPEAVQDFRKGPVWLPGTPNQHETTMAEESVWTYNKIFLFKVFAVRSDATDQDCHWAINRFLQTISVG